MMRTIAHVSDLHFGAVDDDIVDALRACLLQLAPDVIAVSGDLTQRARTDQFVAAGRFLRSLPHRQVVVPGNHDVPLYDVLSRFGRPLGAFRHHITRERFPSFADDEIILVGADTTRSFTIKDGGLRPADVRHLMAVFEDVDDEVLKVVVCHHPLDPPPSHGRRFTVPAPDATAMKTLIERGVDVFLTGHLHLSSTGHSAVRYPAYNRSAIVVDAGTATSTRARGEGNAFNVLRVGADRVRVERLTWDPVRQQFGPTHAEVFVRTERGWAPPIGVPSSSPVP